MGYEITPDPLPVCILGIILIASPSALADNINDDTCSIYLTLDAEEFEISKDESGLDIIYMEGFSSLTSTGDPMLPHDVINVLLPPNVIESSVQLTVVSAKTRMLEGEYNIKPTPPLMAWVDDKWIIGRGMEQNITNGKNLDIYDSDRNYPENYLNILATSQMRKWKFAKVDFFPLQYNPVSKKLTLIESVVIDVRYKLNFIEPTTHLMADTVMDDLAHQMFINYDEASAWYEPEYIGINTSETTYDYVIITTNLIESNSAKLSSFITHKQNQGHDVLVVTQDDFDGLAGQAPNYRAEKIRQWLINNYTAMGIEYVFLIGDPDPDDGDIPMKMCWPMLWDGLYQQSPTDYFYADLTGNWNINGNSYYGEWVDYTTSGGVDLAADVYVGRIPVYDANYAMLDSILQKTVDYETSSSTGWRKSALLPMSFSDSSTNGAYLGEQMKNVYLTPNDYTSWRMYQHGPSGSCNLNSGFNHEEHLSGGSGMPNRWAGTDFGIVAWWGHGNIQGAYVGYGSCSDGAFMLSSNAQSLDNVHPSHTYQCSCSNGYPEDPNNLQYAILKNGGITTTGATRVSWYYVGQTSFAGSPSNAGMGYEYMKRLVQGEPAGDALYGMKSSGVSSPGCNELLMNFYDFNLYGDPEVSLNSANYPPATPSIPSGQSLGIPETSYSYSTSAIDPDGNQVTYTFDWGDDTFSETGFVDSGTSASESHSWSSVGAYNVKAKATDVHGASSGWSDAKQVTIEYEPPTVTNADGAGDIATNSARLNGAITDTGGENPTIYVYWGDNDGETVAGNWDHVANLGTMAVAVFYMDWGCFR